MIESLTSLSGLALVALVSVLLTFIRCPLSNDHKDTDRLVTIFLTGIALQCVHFTEEYLGGLYIHLPRLLGLEPLSAGFFVCFNLFWIAVWVVSAIGIRKNYRPACFPLWFFTLAMILNLVIHPLLALFTAGYFPGLITSPLVGIAGIKLWQEMDRLYKERNRS